VIGHSDGSTAQINPRRYLLTNGQHILIGLTLAETFEFELLEERAPLHADGTVAWEFEGAPQSTEEKRWLFLYEKHDKAYENCRHAIFAA
jgi:hypothetical protein